MADRQENVVDTKFQSNWQGASQGFGLVGNAAASLGGRLMNLTRMFTPLGAAISALTSGALVRQITMINSEFEQTSQVIGGTLSALGFAGGEDPTEQFRNGLGLASQTMRQIQISAAALPGEAEDYITVFRAALPNVSQSIQGNLSDMTTFTNQLTAIGRSFGIDAGQIGADVTRMLQSGRGQAGMQVRTWTQLLPFIRSVEGQANVTAEAFNRMTQPQRAQILSNTFQRLQPMLDEASSTFDAMWGALQSTGRELLRVAGAPIFEGVKAGLEEVNGLLVNADGSFTEMGQQIVNIGTNIGTMVVEAIRQAVEWARSLQGLFERLGNSPLFRQLDRIATTLISAGRSLAGSIGEAGIGGAAGLAGGAAAAGALSGAGATGPAGVALVALGMGIGNFLTRVDAVAETLERWGSLINSVSVIFAPLVGALSMFSNLMGDFVAEILPGVITFFDAMLAPLISVGVWLLNVSTILMEVVRPALNMLWEALGTLLEPIGYIVGILLTGLGVAIIATVLALSVILIPMALVGAALVGLAHGFRALSNWISRTFGDDPAKAPGQQAEASEQRGFLGSLMDRLRQSNENAAEQTAAVEQAAGGGAAARAPGQRGGARTNQDFRYSRFTIEQRFAEGFDPDRIAVAFADDVGRMGEQRLESGFAPLFGTV